MKALLLVIALAANASAAATGVTGKIAPPLGVIDDLVILGTATAAGQPRAHGEATGNVSIPDSTFKNIRFDQSNVNVASMHEFAGDSSTMTAVGAGLYMVACQLRFANNATGNRLVRIMVNGVSSAKQALRAAVSPTATVVQAIYLSNLADGDRIQCQGYQTSTGALDVQSSAGDTTFAMGKIW